MSRGAYILFSTCVGNWCKPRLAVVDCFREMTLNLFCSCANAMIIDFARSHHLVPLELLEILSQSRTSEDIQHCLFHTPP